MAITNGPGDRDGWARLRFAVVGPLLASPPPKGRLRAELERLSLRDWEHPGRGGKVRFSVSTIERWYYQARSAGRIRSGRCAGGCGAMSVVRGASRPC